MRTYVLCALTALLAVALSSCTKVKSYDKPQIKDYGITIVNASMDSIRIKGLETLDTYKWTPDDTIGIYGSEKGENVPYTPFDTTSFCGELVKGTLTLYYPYLSEGSRAVKEWRLPLRPTVNYASTAEDFIYNNMTFICKGQPADFHFAFHTGLLKLEVAIDKERVEAFTLMLYDSTGNACTLAGNMALDGSEPVFTDPAKCLRIENVGGKSISGQMPVILFAALPECDCSSFDIVVENTTGSTVTYHSKTGFRIMRECLTSFTIKEIKTWYGLDGWGSEEGDYIKEGN